MAQLPSSAVELGRLFTLMQEGVDPENLFTALRAAGGGGGDLSQASLSLPPGFSLPANFSLPPGFPGLEGLSLPLGSLPADDHGPPAAQAAGVSAGMEGGGSTDEDEDDHGSVGGTQGGVHNPPPRTGSINDQKCTKVLPASSSAPKYKFVVPNEYVYKFMKHLVERPFHMRDMSGKLWDCVLIQRKNKEKYEYMIQGWRRFGEATGVQEGDTVTIEMVSDTVLQLTLERTGGASTKKRARPGSGPPLPPGVGGADRLGQQDVQQPQLEQQDGGQGGVGRPGGLPLGGMQGAAGGGQYGEGGGPSGPQQLLDLIQQHQQQHAAQQAAQAAQLAGLHTAPARGGTPAPEITPRSLTQHLANGLGAAGGLGQGGFTNQHIAELTSFVNQLDKRQRVGEAHGAPRSAGASGAGAAPAGAIRMLSDVADVEGLVQQYNMVREQLRLAEAKITTLETGVLNIKSVLTRNTDPGLIAMTGVINLLNQMEAQEFLPELTTIGRMTLTGLCSEIRRHLNGVLRMVWILRSLPDDVHNSGGGGGMGGTAPGANSGPG